MHKLVVLIEAIEDPQIIEELWPQFLHHVEEMPNLRREAASRVERFLFGKTVYGQMHELFFNSLTELEIAMDSNAGREAGRLLQQMTGGRMTLFFAEHKEDNLENIRKYKQAK